MRQHYRPGSLKAGTIVLELGRPVLLRDRPRPSSIDRRHQLTRDTRRPRTIAGAGRLAAVMPAGRQTKTTIQKESHQTVSRENDREGPCAGGVQYLPLNQRTRFFL